MQAPAAQTKQPDEMWYLKAKCPVFLPKMDALTMSSTEFATYLTELLKPTTEDADADGTEKGDNSDAFTLVSEQPSTTADARELLQGLTVAPAPADDANMGDASGLAPHDQEKSDVKAGESTGHPFMEGLKSFGTEQSDQSAPPTGFDMENRMRTENNDLAFRSTTEPLLDLFSELEEVVSGPRLHELLNAAWGRDPLATLKIIFNARSIHLGKSSRLTFYRCAGWLATYHPRTLVANLRWLSRPVIAKKLEKKEGDGDEDLVLVEAEKDPNNVSSHDVKNGVAHGYWKDLLNILALSANGKLSVLADPRDILNIEREGKGTSVTKEEASAKRQIVRDERHQAVLKALEEVPVHRALHLEIARLFADQLTADIGLLCGEDAKARRNISLCAKWAPSTARFHDKHTFVASSIAEILYPDDLYVEKGLILGGSDRTEADRTLYLRHARETYRKDISALRKHLGVVERDITAGAFEHIKYDRVPSLAMQNYTPIFARKDTERFGSYLDKVAEGKSRISGATLLPSTLVHAALYGTARSARKGPAKRKLNSLLEARIEAMGDKVLDGQWNTLVQRIKDSGTMQSCIAVCDVSGSMGSPTFSDHTCPEDSAVGLSLLVAEVTQAPFGGSFITFSEHPTVEVVDLSQTFKQKVKTLMSSEWGCNTNFEAVFTDLILPMAVKHKLSQEQMVKRIFVFSDMHFDAAGGDNWSTSFERIQAAYKEAGYEVPELVFWNLAGGRAGYRSFWGDPVAPKPVTAYGEGVALVNGYSQGMLKVFLDEGVFVEEDEEEEVVTAKGVGEDSDVVTVEKPAKKTRIDPMSTLKKAISHKAYSMLEVVD